MFLIKKAWPSYQKIKLTVRIGLFILKWVVLSNFFAVNGTPSFILNTGPFYTFFL